MIREAIATGSTVEAAKEAALTQLNVNDDLNVQYEVMEMPAKKTFGLFGGKDAKVRAYIEETQADMAVQYIEKLLKQMDISGLQVKVEETEKGAEITIDGENASAVIGHRGETLYAIQYLTGIFVNRGEGDYYRIVINVGNYREKRERSLQALARKIAINAAKTRRNTTLEPMTPYERRVIHTAVQKVRGAYSWSVGEEPNRCVVIGPDKKSGDRFDGRSKYPRKPRYNDFDKQGSSENSGSSAKKTVAKSESSDVPLFGKVKVD